MPSASPTREFKVGLLQAGKDHGKNGNPGFEANFALFEHLARRVAAEGPDLIVFPEYAISGWPYPKEEQINSLAETVPGDGPWLSRYAALAQELQCPLLCWVPERDGDHLYNTAALLDRAGRSIGKYRKVHANLGEQTWWGWSQGKGFQLLELDGLKLGVSICADMWFPETVQCQSLLGADVILHMSIADDMEDIIKVRAKDHALPIAACIYNGGSYACDAHGRLLHKASAEHPEAALVRLHPHDIHVAKKYGGLWIPRLGHLNLRQPERYTVVTDPATRPPWTEIFLDHEGNSQSKEQLLERFQGRYDVNDPTLHHIPLVTYDVPWTSPFRVDPVHPHHLINDEGRRLFIVNKTAWAYFACTDPLGVVERAKAQGVNVLRVALEGTPYFNVLGYDLWPWGGTRTQPDWSNFDAVYWDEVERRIDLAGKHGIGIDLVLYMTLKPDAEEIDRQRLYWEHTLLRLSKYANVLTWEIANEYVGNEAFQDAAGRHFKARDPHKRPVCTSDGTTDDAVWPDKVWVDLAVNHTCTSSTERHPLREWYQRVARNTRSHGKPAFCNESGREVRHKNDDPVHRRKQGWIWCTAGGFWTLHSWEGCEGIDDPDYRAPGEAYFKPMAEYFQSLPFWELQPNETALTLPSSAAGEAILTVLAHPRRSRVVAYVCTPASGATQAGLECMLRLPNGEYRLAYLDPKTGATLAHETVRAPGLGKTHGVSLPDFTDDLVIDVAVVRAEARTLIEGTL